MLGKRTEKKVPLIYELVDLAILPAALLICAKALGIAILNTYLDLDWSVHSIPSAIFSVKIGYGSAEDANLISTYSNLFMYICVIVGAMFVTSKSLLFHQRKASPHFVLKLAKYDLLHLLKSSLHIYKEIFIWGVFLILTTVYIFISFLMGETDAWVAGVSVLFTLTFLWITIENIEEDLIYHNYK